jgi:molecular chaperone DnaK (HSP70)
MLTFFSSSHIYEHSSLSPLNSEKDIESMIRDAEANQESDAKRKEVAESKNELDS